MKKPTPIPTTPTHHPCEWIKVSCFFAEESGRSPVNIMENIIHSSVNLDDHIEAIKEEVWSNLGDVWELKAVLLTQAIEEEEEDNWENLEF